MIECYADSLFKFFKFTFNYNKSIIIIATKYIRIFHRLKYSQKKYIHFARWFDVRLVSDKDMSPYLRVSIYASDIWIERISCKTLVDAKRFWWKPFKTFKIERMMCVEIVKEKKKSEINFTTQLSFFIHSFNCLPHRFLPCHSIELLYNDLMKFT